MTGQYVFVAGVFCKSSFERYGAKSRKSGKFYEVNGFVVAGDAMVRFPKGSFTKKVTLVQAQKEWVCSFLLVLFWLVFICFYMHICSGRYVTRGSMPVPQDKL